MKKSILLITIVFLFSLLCATEEVAKRPKIGLALSGGGARGIAHIGVLKVLEELGIEPDYITGTSMGSIVGGLYAIGYTTEQLEDIVYTQDWETLILDTVTRKDVSIEEKEYVERYVGELPIIDNKLVLPSGLVNGQHISKLLADLTISAQQISDFNDLRTPFRCIATDIETGEAVVLDKGFLPEAMRTSMSIPSAFSPMHLDDRLLIDGGLARNLPVSDAIEMGADIVIAVDVSSELYKKEQLGTLVKVMEQSINFRGIERSKEQQKLADILIIPELDDYGILSFGRCDLLVEAGEKAANNSIDELKKIANEQKKYEREDRGIPLLKVDNLHINKIRIKGLKTVSKNLIIGKMKINENSCITFKQLSDAIDRLYGSQYFARVTYRLFPSQKGVDLEVRVIEKSNNVFNFSFQYNSDTKSAILLNQTTRNIFINGSRLMGEVKLSENPGGAFSYFVHTGWKPGFGIGTKFEYENIKFPIKIDSNYNHYNFRRFFGRAVIQTVFINHSAFGLGVQKEYFSFESLDIVLLERSYFDLTNLYCFFELDKLDKTIYPSEGVRLRLKYENILDVNSQNYQYGTAPFQRYLLKFERYQKVNSKISFFGKLNAGFIVGDIDKVPSNFKIIIGGNSCLAEGMFPMLGQSNSESFYKNAIVYKAGIQYNVWRKFYVIPALNIGNNADLLEYIVNMDNYVLGSGLSVGLNTPFGLIEYTISKNNENSKIFQYWDIGYNF